MWTQCHSLAFDVSVWEIFGALLRGGRLVVVPESVAASAGGLPRSCWSTEQVSVLTQTPSAVAMLSPQGLESAALVIVGEACPADVVDRWAPGRVMVNAYGPTETTMCVAISAPLTAGTRGGAHRLAGRRGGTVRPGPVVAPGARRAWSASCMSPVAGWASAMCAGPG